ncbi:hypothetical protein BH10BAC3_BH10BAC3_20670 [soil metagenome]
MKIYTALLIIALVLLHHNLSAQNVQQTGWLASFNTIKLHKKWSLHLEIQVRSTDNWEQVQTILPRVGLNYQVKTNQILTAGYAYIPNRVNAFDETALLAEHRIWQQYIINQKAGSAVITHRLRLEERFTPVAGIENNELVVTDRKYSTRLRYFARAVIPFKKQQPFVKGPFLGLQEELFFNISDRKNVNGKWFDQNRAYAAFGYRFSKKFDIEIGYLNQYVERSSTQPNVINHIMQLAFYTRL